MDVRSALRPLRAAVFAATWVALTLRAAPCRRSPRCCGRLWPTSRGSSTIRPDPTDTDKLEVTDRGHSGRRTRPEHPAPVLTLTETTATAAGSSPNGNAALVLGIIGVLGLLGAVLGGLALRPSRRRQRDRHSLTMTDHQVPGRSGRRRWHAVVGLSLTAGALLAGAGTAWAHAVLVSTDPARDTVLATLPAQVSLTFGEPVQLPPGGLRVFDPDGVEVDDGHTSHPSGRGDVVQIGVRPGAEQGSYTVAWRVISADTHPVSGAFTFSVGHPSATPAATAAPPGGSTTVGVLYGIVRALAYGSFAALVGAGALMLFCWPAGAARAVAPRVAVGGWAALLMATVGTLLLQGPYGNGIGIGDVLEPGAVTTTLELPLGSALVARLLLLVVTAIYLGQLIARLPTAAPKVHAALAVGGVALAIWIAATWSASGHAAVGLQPEIAFPVDVAHLVAMGVWLGGLLVLALALRRPPTEPAEQRELATAVARFSPIASGCVAVLVATGTYQSWRQLGSWPAFLATDYGRVLLVKLIAVGALLAAAALFRRAVGRMRSRPAAERQPVGVGVGSSASPTPAPIDSGAADPTLRHTVLGETAVAVVVLGLTAVLVNTEPGRTALAAAATHAPTADSTVAYDTGGPSGTGTLDVRIAPSRTGPNVVDVTVRGARGTPVDLPELDAELSLPDQHLGPLTLTVTREGPGRYRADGQIPIAGTWQLALTVRTSDINETTVGLPITIR
ncbi:MAG: FixH family protein [Actinomycetota bacterium]|nr:FixH family protein [Actinomycetota bacterium]